MKTWEIGYFGERETARYLREHGFRVLTANYKTRFGEIDIIAEKGGILVFVEVKTRAAGAMISAADAVDFRKRERLRKAALSYLAYSKDERPARFDVAEIYYHEAEDRLVADTVNYMENAF